MLQNVALNHFHNTFPDDATLIPSDGAKLLLISNVHSKNGAAGQIMFVYPSQPPKAYKISELLSIDIETGCTGFHFVAPTLHIDQELLFTFQLFY